MKIVRLGSVDIQLPIIEIGSARKPLLCVIAGVHGDETTGLFVIRRLLEIVRHLRIRGMLRIIPSASPFAQATRTRHTVLDMVDMNRVFAGSGKGVGEITAASLLGALRGSDVVIDLHSFGMETPLMGIIVKSKKQVTSRSMRLLSAFSPEQVWFIDPKGDEEKFKGSLGFQLGDAGIANFAVELDHEELFSDEQVERCTEGILRVMGALGMIKIRDCCSGKGLRIFKRTVQKSSTSGIFIPLKRPFDEVREGEPIGRLVSLPTFSESLVKSSSSGTIMQVARKRFVMPGEELISIGKEVG